MKKTALGLVGLIFTFSEIAADKVRLKNGEVIEGKVEKEDEKFILLKPQTGVTKEIKRTDIDEITYTSDTKIKLEKPQAEEVKPLQESGVPQVRPLPGWVGEYFRFQTRDGVVVSQGRIISETDDLYWVAPNTEEGNAFMIPIRKNQLVNSPQKVNTPLKAGGQPTAAVSRAVQGYWTGGRISIQTSYMRDAGWYKMGPYSNNQRGISAISTHLAYEHSLVDALKVQSMLIPGFRLEGTMVRMSSLTEQPNLKNVTRSASCCGITVSDVDSWVTVNGFILAGGQIQGGLTWLFPMGNHRITFSPQIGLSVLNQEIISNDTSAGFTLTGIGGYEYLLGSVSLMLNFRISYIDYPAIAPITLMGLGMGIAYHIPE